MSWFYSVYIISRYPGSWLLTRVRCQDHQTQRLALWQPWQDFAQNWRIQLAQQIHGSEVKFMAFLDLSCLNKLRKPSNCDLSYQVMTRIFVLFNLLDFLVRLSYTSMASLVSLVPQRRVPCLAVCLEASGSSKCQIEWWSSATNPPTDNDGQVPFPIPVGKNYHWKYLPNYSSQTFDSRSLAEAHKISTISSVSPFHHSFLVQDRIFCAFSSCTVSTKKARLPQKPWRPEGAEGIRGPFQTIGAMLAKKPGQMSLVFGPCQISVVGSYLVNIMKDQYSTESSWRIRKPPTGSDSPFLILFPHITFFLRSGKQLFTSLVLTSRSPCLDASTNCHHWGLFSSGRSFSHIGDLWSLPSLKVPSSVATRGGLVGTTPWKTPGIG